MPYKNIVFAKLEKRLQNDPRWYMMSEPAQLNYVRFILFAAETYNKIPKNLQAIKKQFKTDQDLETIEKTIKEIRANFPKFKQDKRFYYFKDFQEKTNYIPKQEILGKSRGLPKDGVDKEEDKEEDKEKEEDKNRLPFSKFKKEAIQYLNEKTGKSFSLKNYETNKFLNGRFNEGKTIEDVKLVIDNRVWRWSEKTEMLQYLCPSTLFRPSNFEKYLQDAKQQKQTERSIVDDEKSNGLPKEKPKLTKKEEEQIHRERVALQKKIREKQGGRNGQGKTERKEGKD